MFTAQHDELRRSLRRFVERELDPYADEWEEAGIAPLHEIFRKAGAAGFLGITKPEDVGGMGLDRGDGEPWIASVPTTHTPCQGNDMSSGASDRGWATLPARRAATCSRA